MKLTILSLLMLSHIVWANSTLETLLKAPKETSIIKNIKELTSYQNRHYKSRHGVKASKDLYKKWKSISSGRSDVEVNLIDHSKFPQQSVEMIIHGSNTKRIVIGGHIDTINEDDHSLEARAPGADDNASGIATITEVIRSLINTNYKPTYTLAFYAYAGEEFGMLGSLDVVETYFLGGIPVKGVLQLDGTNYNGSDIKIALITSHSNAQHNELVGKLIDKHLKVPWGYDKCATICSDHFSWYNRGYPVSFPFEAMIKEENPFIHSENDTLNVTNNRATHALLFAKLGLVYIYHMDTAQKAFAL